MAIHVGSPLILFISELLAYAKFDREGIQMFVYNQTITSHPQNMNMNMFNHFATSFLGQFWEHIFVKMILNILSL